MSSRVTWGLNSSCPMQPWFIPISMLMGFATLTIWNRFGHCSNEASSVNTIRAVSAISQNTLMNSATGTTTGRKWTYSGQHYCEAYIPGLTRFKENKGKRKFKRLSTLARSRLAIWNSLVQFLTMGQGYFPIGGS